MFLDKVDAAIIEGLSEDSRAYLKTIAERAGCSIQTVSNRLNKLYPALGLRHSVEINLPKAGFPLQFFVKAKLSEGTSFDSSSFSEAVSSIPFVQFAALTKGDFDLLLWCVARSNEEYLGAVEWPLRMRFDRFFSDWSSHPVLHNRAGFLPVDNSLVELMDVPGRKKTLLKLLNNDSRMALTDLSKKLMVTEPTSEYHLKRVKPFVKRFTSFFEGKGEFMHLVRFIQSKGTEEEYQVYGRRVSKMYLKSDPRLFNRMVSASAVSGGMDVVFIENFTSLEDNEAYTEQLVGYGSIVRKHASAIVTKVLKGMLPIRKVDYSRECKYVISPAEVSE